VTWSGTQGSAIFAQALLNPLLQAAWTLTKPTSYVSLSADTIDCALFLGTNTPNKTDTLANSAYNVGQWVSATYEASGTNYSAGGNALASKAFAIDATATNTVSFTAANPTWTTVTLAAVFGDLVYDFTISGGTVAKQALCFNYFGGSQSVTAGTFTIQWATPGGATSTAVFDITC
jgi:hypothetical protein